MIQRAKIILKRTANLPDGHHVLSAFEALSDRASRTGTPAASTRTISQDSLNILVLIDERSRKTSTVDDHISSLENQSENNIFVFDYYTISAIDVDFDIFDVIILHYSVVISSESYINSNLSDKLRNFKGIKVAFLQDEYRWVDRTASAILRLGISVVFTVVNKDAIPRVYHHTSLRCVRFEQTLTGYVPEHLPGLRVPAYEDRPVDVAYRARKLPGWLGAFGQEKWLIGERFAKDAQRYELKCDIAFAEADRLYKGNWIRFLAGAKAVLGTESGASVVDFSDEIRQEVEAFLIRNPTASFDEIQQRFLGDRDGTIVIHVISPRCFEAAALRTLMIMYRGEYSGILEAGRHYVPLERDHSNMEQVVGILRDPDKAGEIIDNAYREIACSNRWTFQSMVAHFDRVVTEEVYKKLSSTPTATRQPISEAEIVEWRKNVLWLSRLRRARTSLFFRLQALKNLARGLIKILPAPVYRVLVVLIRPPAIWIEKRIKNWLLGDNG